MSGETLISPLVTGVPVDTPADEQARAVLERWSSWPQGQIALTGSPGSGRSFLSGRFARRIGAGFLSAPFSGDEVLERLTEKGLVIDDADVPPVGEGLLSALNLCRARSVPLLLTGGSVPSHWPAIIRDLQSRLDALPSVVIGVPCERTLYLRLVAASRRHFIRLPDSVLSYLAAHMPRDYRLIEVLVRRLSVSSVERRLTLALAREVLSGL